MAIVKSYNKFFEQVSELDPYGEENFGETDQIRNANVNYLNLIYVRIPEDYPLNYDQFHNYLGYDDGKSVLTVSWKDGDRTIEVNDGGEIYTYNVEDYQKVVDYVISWFIRNDIPENDEE